MLEDQLAVVKFAYAINREFLRLRQPVTVFNKNKHKRYVQELDRHMQNIVTFATSTRLVAKELSAACKHALKLHVEYTRSVTVGLSHIPLTAGHNDQEFPRTTTSQRKRPDPKDYFDDDDSSTVSSSSSDEEDYFDDDDSSPGDEEESNQPNQLKKPDKRDFFDDDDSSSSDDDPEDAYLTDVHQYLTTSSEASSKFEQSCNDLVDTIASCGCAHNYHTWSASQFDEACRADADSSPACNSKSCMTTIDNKALCPIKLSKQLKGGQTSMRNKRNRNKHNISRNKHNISRNKHSISRNKHSVSRIKRVRRVRRVSPNKHSKKHSSNHITQSKKHRVNHSNLGKHTKRYSATASNSKTNGKTRGKAKR
jgi:hypothetical protein